MNRFSFLAAALAVSGLGLLGCEEKGRENANQPPPGNMQDMYTKGTPTGGPASMTQPSGGATTQDTGTGTEGTDAAQPSGSTIGGAVDDATNRVSEGAKDATDATREAGNDAAEGAREAGKDLSEAAGNAAESAGDAAQDAGNAAENATDDAGDGSK